jgi:hypothetical protein
VPVARMGPWCYLVFGKELFRDCAERVHVHATGRQTGDDAPSRLFDDDTAESAVTAGMAVNALHTRTICGK